MSPGDNKAVGSYLTGDTDPTEMDFEAVILPEELAILLVSSMPIQKQCIWLPSQALAAGWKFKQEGAFEADKFGNPYKFPSFTDWFNWCGAYTEVLKAMIWATLFHRSIVLHFLPEENPTTLDGSKGKCAYYGEVKRVSKPVTDIPLDGDDNGEDVVTPDMGPESQEGSEESPNNENVEKPSGPIFTKTLACYEFLDGNGFEIESYDDDEEPEVYSIATTPREKMPQGNIPQTSYYYIHKSRVVKFSCLTLIMGYDGTSKIQTTAHLAIMQRHFLQSVVTMFKNMSAGITAIKVGSEEEKTALKASVQKVLAHTLRLWYQGSLPVEELIKTIIPDMKADQIAMGNLLINKQLAAAMNISIRFLGEEDIATGIGEGGAGISHLQTKFEIMEIQRHFKRSIEEVFYLLGKDETEFEWNQPMAKDEELIREQGQINLALKSQDDGSLAKEEEKKLEDQKNPSAQKKFGSKIDA